MKFLPIYNYPLRGILELINGKEYICVLEGGRVLFRGNSFGILVSEENNEDLDRIVTHISTQRYHEETCLFISVESEIEKRNRLALENQMREIEANDNKGSD